MESYRHRPTHVPVHTANLEAETAASTMEFLSDYYLSETEAEREWSLMREEQFAYLWREAEAEAGRFSSTPWETDEESARSRGKRYEEMVLEQLETRNFDEEEERHEDEEELICSVCLERLYRGTVAALDCRHEFHVDCIKRWLVGGKNFCPLCRATALPSLDYVTQFFS